ncbi:lysophosphatidic acid receptor 5 [Alligator mississippiensis]|uniref:snRNA-activating protein complex subunit 2 n=1 Tax=Alligator mississippiensis TaxID=8496 RepID=A0A151PHM2_ALLMI|nr:lysophosphatidic acid receptor 5 [Alligator mississippiensis]KYO48404.1 snRNA-activating protein complex subunit 2 [Alligator mississippiensis]
MMAAVLATGNNTTAVIPLTQLEDAVLAGGYTLISLLALALNGAALRVFCSSGASLLQQTPTALYMAHLAACDLLLAATLPLRVAHYSWRPRLLPQQLCELAGLALLVHMYGSLFLLAALSGDRCAAVLFPLRPRICALRRHAKYICLGAWVLSGLGAVPTYAWHPAVPLPSEASCFDTYPRYVTQPAVAAAMGLCFVVPLLVVVLSAWGLLRAVGRSAGARLALERPAKARRLVLASVAIFLICFLPFHLVLLGYQLPWLPQVSLDRAYRGALLLACANAALDPLTYYYASDTFQQAVLWGCCRERTRTPPPPDTIALRTVGSHHGS